MKSFLYTLSLATAIFQLSSAHRFHGLNRKPGHKHLPRDTPKLITISGTAVTTPSTTSTKNSTPSLITISGSAVTTTSTTSTKSPSTSTTSTPSTSTSSPSTSSPSTSSPSTSSPSTSSPSTSSPSTSSPSTSSSSTSSPSTSSPSTSSPSTSSPSTSSTSIVPGSADTPTGEADPIPNHDAKGGSVFVLGDFNESGGYLNSSGNCVSFPAHDARKAMLVLNVTVAPGLACAFFYYPDCTFPLPNVLTSDLSYHGNKSASSSNQPPAFSSFQCWPKDCRQPEPTNPTPMNVYTCQADKVHELAQNPPVGLHGNDSHPVSVSFVPVASTYFVQPYTLTFAQTAQAALSTDSSTSTSATIAARATCEPNADCDGVHVTTTVTSLSKSSGAYTSLSTSAAPWSPDWTAWPTVSVAESAEELRPRRDYTGSACSSGEGCTIPVTTTVTSLERASGVYTSVDTTLTDWATAWSFSTATAAATFEPPSSEQ